MRRPAAANDVADEEHEAQLEMSHGLMVLANMDGVHSLDVVVLSQEIQTPIKVFVIQSGAVVAVIIEDPETMAFFKTFNGTASRRPKLQILVSTQPLEGEDWEGADGIIVAVSGAKGTITHARLPRLCSNFG